MPGLELNLGLMRSGGNASRLAFNTGLVSTDEILTPIKASWGTTATFSRASAQYVTDFEGLLRRVESGSVAVEGSRVVTNLLTYSEDLSNAAWVVAGTASKNGNVISFPAVADSVRQAAPGVTSIPGQIFRSSFTLSGSGTTNITIYDGVTLTNKEVTLSAVPTRYTVSMTIGSSGSVNSYVRRLTGNTATSVTVHNAQLENVTAQSNLPGEYVKTTSAAVSKCFATTNGNTVDGNGVVTEGVGTPLPTSYPEWTAQKQYAINDRIQAGGWWYYATNVAGPSGASAPTWPTGSTRSTPWTVADGSMYWTLGGRLLLGYVSEPASSNKVTGYGLIPADTLGSEKVTNGGFTAWTGDNPDNWTVTESGGNIVTQSGNAARIVSDGTMVELQQNISMSAGKIYQYSVNITNVTSGSVVLNTSGVTIATYSTTGIKTGTFLATSAVIGMKRAAACDVTFTDLSIKEVTWAVGTKSYYTGSAFQQNITGLTLSGGTAAVLSIVTDETEITKAGLGGINPSYKVYKLDNSGGSTNATCAVSGTVGNTNAHSYKFVGRREGSGLTKGYLNLTDTDAIVTSASYVIAKFDNAIPSATSRPITLLAGAGQTLYFLLPQLEELPYTTSIMPTSGGTATRAATSDAYQASGNLRTLACSGMFEYTPNMTGGTTTRWLWGSYTDANNALGVFVDGTNVTFRKRVGGSNYDATKAFTITAGTTSRIGWRINADGSTDIFVNGVKGTGNSNTTTPVIAATFKLGDDGNGANSSGGAELRNWKTYFKALADGRF